MKLYWSPRSPFVRKVMITLHETGLTDQVERVRYVADSTKPPSPELLAANPLGKIPVLELDNGATLYDSRVICEYLDLVAVAGLFPKDPADRMTQLHLQATADGLTDLLLLWRIEYLRGLGRSGIVDGYSAKVKTTLDYLSNQLDDDCSFGIGQIALICCLGQLDFRWGDSGWRDVWPALADWADKLASRPSIKANPVVNDEAPPSCHDPITIFER